MTITPYNVSKSPRPDMSRNVQDMYKRSLDEEIRADLDTRRSAAVQVFMNTENDFNISSAIRTHNGLNAGACYIVGRRKFDKRGTQGSHNYMHVFSATGYEEVFDKLHDDGYTIYAVDNILEHNPKNFWDVKFEEKSAFVYGTENMGLSDDVIKACDDMIYIDMLGSIRSFNLACTSSMVLSEYSRQHRNSF